MVEYRLHFLLVRSLSQWRNYVVMRGANAFVRKEDNDIFEQTSPPLARRRWMRCQQFMRADFALMWWAWIDSMIQLYKNGDDLCKVELKTVYIHDVQHWYYMHAWWETHLVPAHHPIYLQQSIPGARLHRYPNGSHAIYYSHAEHFNKLVMQFMLEWVDYRFIQGSIYWEGGWREDSPPNSPKNCKWIINSRA